MNYEMTTIPFAKFTFRLVNFSSQFIVTYSHTQSNQKSNLISFWTAHFSAVTSPPILTIGTIFLIK